MNTANLGIVCTSTEAGKRLPFRMLCVAVDHDVTDSTVLLARAARQRTTLAGFLLHLVKPVNPKNLLDVFSLEFEAFFQD